MGIQPFQTMQAKKHLQLYEEIIAQQFKRSVIQIL